MDEGGGAHPLAVACKFEPTPIGIITDVTSGIAGKARIETEGEAIQESQLMEHAVEKYFKQYAEEATRSFVPPATMRPFEQKIGLKSHVQKAMPVFVTLRDGSGTGLVTAMLPPGGRDERSFRPIVVGPKNNDP